MNSRAEGLEIFSNIVEQIKKPLNRYNNFLIYKFNIFVKGD